MTFRRRNKLLDLNSLTDDEAVAALVGGLKLIDPSDPAAYAGASCAGVAITGVQGANVLTEPDWDFGGVEQEWARAATEDDAGSFIEEGDIVITQPGLYRFQLGVGFAAAPDRAMVAWVSTGGYVRDLLSARGGGTNGNYFLFGVDDWAPDEEPRIVSAQLRWPSFGTVTSATPDAVELEIFRLAAP